MSDIVFLPAKILQESCQEIKVFPEKHLKRFQSNPSVLMCPVVPQDTFHECFVISMCFRKIQMQHCLIMVVFKQFEKFSRACSNLRTTKESRATWAWVRKYVFKLPRILFARNALKCSNSIQYANLVQNWHSQIPVRFFYIHMSTGAIHLSVCLPACHQPYPGRRYINNSTIKRTTHKHHESEISRKMFVI